MTTDIRKQVFDGQPLLLAPQAVDAFSDAISKIESLTEDQKSIDNYLLDLELAYGFTIERSKPFPYAANGLAVIPIMGTLLNRYSWAGTYATGYDAISKMLEAAIDDPDVKGIVFDVNSSGGHCAGCFELSEKIRESRSAKPSVAIVNAAAYSAAYALASAAGKVYATPSAGVGSIGVLQIHLDMSKWNEKVGDNYTLIYSGKHKVDGNPYEPLPAAVKARMQAGVDKMREKFAGVVGANRSLDTKAILATEADSFDAEQGKTLGLVDAVMTADDALAAFVSGLSGSKTVREIPRMTTQANPGSDQAQAAAEAATKDAVNKAVTETTASVKARIKAITGSEHAKGREELADHLAMDTDMPAEAAIAVLQKSPKAEAVKADDPKGKTTPFEQAMNNGKNPEVSADGGKKGGEGEGEGEDRAARIAKNYAAATGEKLIPTTH